MARSSKRATAAPAMAAIDPAQAELARAVVQELRELAAKFGRLDPLPPGPERQEVFAAIHGLSRGVILPWLASHQRRRRPRRAPEMREVDLGL